MKKVFKIIRGKEAYEKNLDLAIEKMSEHGNMLIEDYMNYASLMFAGHNRSRRETKDFLTEMALGMLAALSKDLLKGIEVVEKDEAAIDYDGFEE